jgi:uncharacterized protein YlaI
MIFCDECEDRLAMTRFRYLGTECELCQECADRVARTSSASLEPIGPADNLPARLYWAQSLIVIALSQAFGRRPFDELVGELADVIELPPFVLAVASEAAQAAGPARLVAKG